MPRTKKNIEFGGVYFVDALASSVGIILLILFVILSLGLERYTPKKLSKLLEENILEGNMPIETGYLVKGGPDRKITDQCFCYYADQQQNLKCPLVKVFDDRIELVWAGKIIYRDQFFTRKDEIIAYIEDNPVNPEELSGLYFLIYENGMYHFLNDFNNEELKEYWNKEWITSDKLAIVEANTGGSIASLSNIPPGSTGSGAAPQEDPTEEEGGGSLAANTQEPGRRGAGTPLTAEEDSAENPAPNGTPPTENTDPSEEQLNQSNPNNATPPIGSPPQEAAEDNPNNTPANPSAPDQNTSEMDESGSPAPDVAGKTESNSDSDGTSQAGSPGNPSQADTKEQNTFRSFRPPNAASEQGAEADRPLTEREQEIMQNPKLDSLLQVHAESAAESQAAMEASKKATEDSQKQMNYEEFKKELVKSGAADSILNNTAQVKKILNEQAAKQVTSTLAQKKKFSVAEYKEVVEPILENRKEEAAEKSSKIIFPDEEQEAKEYDPITQEELIVPGNSEFAKEQNYILPLSEPIKEVAILELGEVYVIDLTQDTSLRFIFELREQPLPYAEGYTLVNKAGFIMSLDSAALEESPIPVFSYTWIPVRFTSASGETLFEENQMYVYGMQNADALFLPGNENHILITDFKFEEEPNAPPNFLWPRIIFGTVILIIFLLLFLLYARKTT